MSEFIEFMRSERVDGFINFPLPDEVETRLTSELKDLGFNIDTDIETYKIKLWPIKDLRPIGASLTMTAHK